MKKMFVLCILGAYLPGFCGDEDPDLQPPSPPSSFTVPASAYAPSVQVSWGAATGQVTYYQLFQIDPSGSEFLAYSGLNRSAEVDLAQPGVHRFRVRACNGVARSSFRHAETLASPPESRLGDVRVRMNESDINRGLAVLTVARVVNVGDLEYGALLQAWMANLDSVEVDIQPGNRVVVYGLLTLFGEIDLELFEFDKVYDVDFFLYGSFRVATEGDQVRLVFRADDSELDPSRNLSGILRSVATHALNDHFVNKDFDMGGFTLPALPEELGVVRTEIETDEHEVVLGLTLNKAPTARFTYAVGPNQTTFTDMSYDDLGIVSWAWSFGDGGVSNERHPTHQYANPGAYEVRLTVTDGDGVSSSLTKTIDVGTLTPPTGVMVTFADGKHPHITWTAVSGANSYRVERALGNGSFEVIGTTVGSAFTDQMRIHPNHPEAPSSSLTVTWYRIQAVSGSATSRPSNALSVKTKLYLIEEPF